MNCRASCRVDEPRAGALAKEIACSLHDACRQARAPMASCPSVPVLPACCAPSPFTLQRCVTLAQAVSLPAFLHLGADAALARACQASTPRAQGGSRPVACVLLLAYFQPSSPSTGALLAVSAIIRAVAACAAASTAVTASTAAAASAAAAAAASAAVAS